MSAVTMDSHVIDFVPKHERAVVRASHKAGTLAKLGLLLRSVQIGFAMGFIATRIDSNARWLRDQSLWFVGAAKAIDSQDRTSPLDPDFVVVDRLRGMEDRLISQQREAMTDIECFPQVVRRSLKRYQECVGDMLEAVSDLRGAIQAYEADRCAGAPTHAEQQTAEALERILQGRTTAE